MSTFVFLITAAPATLRSHTPYNHFALLADAWLQGRLDLGKDPPAYTGNNDFAVFEEQTYVSFPPFPAILILPIVKIASSVEAVPDGLFFILFAGFAPAFLFLSFHKLSQLKLTSFTQLESIALALLFSFGSVYWFTAIQGTVWFAAHAVGTSLLCAYLYCAINAEHPFISGTLLGCAFATRTTLLFAGLFFVFEVIRAHRTKPLPHAMRSVIQFTLPCLTIGLLLMLHNQLRFGSPFEFGHRYLDIVWRSRIDRWGLFSFHYLGKNLAVMLTSLPWIGSTSAPFQINAHGLALWITSPFLIWSIWPKSANAMFRSLTLCAALIALTDLLYQNSGWIQFGYRFSNDFTPFLFLMLALGQRPRGPIFIGLSIVAIVINAFGAISFQRPGYERFYVVERTQTVLFEPD